MQVRPSTREIRKAFLDFFAGHGHRVVASSSLIPGGDSTLLFTNAGMNQFKDVFVGRETRDYVRAASCQKCVRAGGKHNDLDNVGYTARHLTFFEMLGNFSFGDYFKAEAIRLAWGLLVDVYALPVERLWFTVYTDDDEAARLWQEVGAPPERILRFGDKDNFWAMGETGPCGPCSEIHFYQGDDLAGNQPELVNGPGDETVEIWNLVFMQYERDAAGHMRPLPRPCVDTGAGLERVTAVKQGARSSFDIDVFAPVFSRLEQISNQAYEAAGELGPAFRVIADHARATAFLMTDGVVPSNDGRGYVLRRIIRRALRYGRQLGLDGVFLADVVPAVIEAMREDYPELVERWGVLEPALRAEEERFARTLNLGTDVVGRELQRLKRAGEAMVPGMLAFRLYETHGIPFDLLQEFAQEEGLPVDREGFEAALAGARERGQESWKGDLLAHFREEYERLVEHGVRSQFVGYRELVVDDARVVALLGEGGQVEALHGPGEVVLDRTPFYAEAGGQIGDRGRLVWAGGRAQVRDTQRPVPGLVVVHVEVEEGTLVSGQTVRAEVHPCRRLDTQANHTATHLLHAALRAVLGPGAQQAGSYVEPERLRFDFNWGQPLLAEQLEAIETLVNQAIRSNHEVSAAEMGIEQARAAGAVALFGEKYGETVRVVWVNDGSVSRELCGGCHVQRTGDIGAFKITSERGVAAGVRRIEAVTGRCAVELFQGFHRALRVATAKANVGIDELGELISGQEKRIRELEQEVKGLKLKLAAGGSSELEVQDVAGVALLVREAPPMGAPELRTLADTLRGKLKSGVVVLGMPSEDAATLLVAVTDDVAERVDAGEVVKRLAPIVGGRGGGKRTLAQAGGKSPEKLGEALAAAAQVVKELLG
ncbi:MAG: alanine--tRNA ligase [Thermoanaerobaculaceae bacterium]|nr:alanine--tRNA ligase [Thermoanaerobaculaceae bacterium]MDI9620946.1 alanine--tRNA ligase [Acidobacteriota bacterium]NLH09842.1 alanine--tRNA ligase [Holophagae bacterium]HPW56429.1 alanine--tRNA ligase [Thermoanaerobaculaceae bacterium]